MARTDVGDVANLRRWLTTVVPRVCLDMLRARRRVQSKAPRSDRDLRQAIGVMDLRAMAVVAAAITVERLAPAR